MVDANKVASGDQAFSFLGTAALNAIVIGLAANIRSASRSTVAITCEGLLAEPNPGFAECSSGG